MDASVTLIAPADLRRGCENILAAVGVPTAAASITAQSLVRADMRGQGSHGVMRLETYVKRITAGLISPDATPRMIHDGGSVLGFDGSAGLGHIVGHRVMKACIERARETGLALATVHNSSHFGVAGFFALQATPAEMVGVAMSNGPALVAPIGGRVPILGTNPLAIAIPVRGRAPILLDMATSAAALGKILRARDSGVPIPPTWALDGEGNVTIDATIAAAARTLQPLAGPKGFGLALVIEVLTAVLSGASVAQHAGSMLQTWDRPEDLGHAFIALRVEALMPAEQFFSRMADLVGQITDSQRVDPTQEILLPGDPETRAEERAHLIGVALDAGQLRTLRRLADEVAASVPF